MLDEGGWPVRKPRGKRPLTDEQLRWMEEMMSPEGLMVLGNFAHFHKARYDRIKHLVARLREEGHVIEVPEGRMTQGPWKLIK